MFFVVLLARSCMEKSEWSVAAATATAKGKKEGVGRPPSPSPSSLIHCYMPTVDDTTVKESVRNGETQGTLEERPSQSAPKPHLSS